MQQPENPSGAQVVVLVQGMPTATDTGFRNMKEKFSRLLIVLGVAHIVIGILCIIFQGVLYGESAFFIYLMLKNDGISAGVLFIVTGAFGIRGGQKNGKCQIVAFNVLSIISAVYAASLLVVVIPSVMYASDLNGSTYYSGFRIKLVLAMAAMLIILAILEGIVAICSSVVCCYIGACFDDCGPSCCCPSEPQYNQLGNTDQQVLAQQQFNISNQQQAMFNANQQQAIALLVPHQPAFSALAPEATGQGPHTGQFTGLTNAPLPTEMKAKGGKEGSEGANYYDNPELYGSAYDDDSEYHY